MMIELKIAQLLCSRLCHDLVGAASAINAGLEMIEGEPNEMSGPLGLMNTSAAQMTRRLAFYRVAFGLAEGARGMASVDEIRKLAGDFFSAGKVTLNWPDTASHTGVSLLSAEAAKVCLNLLLMASASLPRGGILTLHFSRIPEGVGIVLDAVGQGVGISEETAAGLDPQAGIDRVNVHNVHVFLARTLAQSVGGEIECRANSDGVSVQIACLFPNA